MDVDIDLDIHIYIYIIITSKISSSIITNYYCYYYCILLLLLSLLLLLLLLLYDWCGMNNSRIPTQYITKETWDILRYSTTLTLSLSANIYAYIYVYIDHYWIWLGHVTKKSWLSLHIDLGLSSTQGLPTVEGPLRDGGRLRSLEVSTDKPLHPNNITWHPLDSHASCFFGAAVTMLLWCRHKLQS